MRTAASLRCAALLEGARFARRIGRCRSRASRALIFGALALLAAGCDRGGHNIEDQVEGSARAEAGEALEEGAEGLVAAIREALDAAAGGDGTFAVANGEVTLAGDPASVTATIVIDRSEEGEAPVEVELEDGSVPRAGGALTGGIVTIATEGHLELGGARGGHAHGEGGGEEEEEEVFLPLLIEIVLPASAGDTADLRFQGRSVPLELEEDFPSVP